MAYASKDLSVLAYANGFTLWHYSTVDLTADVNAANYFDDAADMLRVGDIVVANVDTAGTPAGGMFLVNSNTAGVVDVADMTQVGAVEGDELAEPQESYNPPHTPLDDECAKLPVGYYWAHTEDTAEPVCHQGGGKFVYIDSSGARLLSESIYIAIGDPIDGPKDPDPAKDD